MMKKIIHLALVLGAILALAKPVKAIDEFDEKVIKLELTLEEYNSTLQGLEQVLIDTAEKYGLDWTLLAAISGTESSFAKHMPYQCNNPFGWGIYGDNKLCFESLEQAILEVGEGIGTKYNTTSLNTIARTYNSVSTEGWISHTTFFMNKIKNKDIPVSRLPITL